MPFSREDVAIRYSAFRHTWNGDVNAGREWSGTHDPYGPYILHKTLFPKRWFGTGTVPDYDIAEGLLREAIRKGVVSAPVELRPGVWGVDIMHDEVVTHFVLLADASVDALWLNQWAWGSLR